MLLLPESGQEQRCLLNEPAQVTQIDQQVGKGDISGSAVQAIGPNAFQAKPGELAIASFDGILGCVIVSFPEWRLVRKETCQALVSRAIGMNESASEVGDEAHGTVWVTERTICVLRLLRVLEGTDLATDPASTQTAVIEAIERHTVAVSTERITVLVIATGLAGVLIFVALVVADGDHRDDAVVVEWVKTALEASGSVGDELGDVHLWQTLAQMGKIVGHNGSFVRVCGLS